jgi:DNA (cytosine-5)-methyltransferase 1
MTHNKKSSEVHATQLIATETLMENVKGMTETTETTEASDMPLVSDEEQAGQTDSPSAQALPPARSFRFGDLFCGLGGIRLAAEQAGGTCVFSSEIDKYARLVYHENFHEWPSGDITQIDAENVPDHDVLCGGFPCQSVSIAGNQKGFEDEKRGRLFFEIVRIVRVKKPAAILLENVPNLLMHDGGRTFSTIKRMLEDAGYVVFHQILNASLFGSPTARKRVYIVCFRQDMGVNEFTFPQPTYESVHLADMLQPDGETEKYVVRNHPFYPDQAGLDAAIADGRRALRTLPVGRVDEKLPVKQGYRVFSPEGHAVTFLHRGGGVGAQTGLYLVNGRVRKLAAREMARCMGFPDSFVIPESISYERARQGFGNSVVVPVVQKICERIAQLLSTVTAIVPVAPPTAPTTVSPQRTSYGVLDGAMPALPNRVRTLSGKSIAVPAARQIFDRVVQTLARSHSAPPNSNLCP